MPGFRVHSVVNGPRGTSVRQVRDAGDEFAVPTGHRVKGVSAFLDPDGRELHKWVKTTEGDDPVDYASALKEAFANFKPVARPKAAPALVAEELLTLVPCNDWHVGMYAWGREVGESWDLGIAERVIGQGVDDLIARTPASAVAVALGGGDLLHSDNNFNRTAKSGNALDVDGRHAKVLEVATRLMVRVVDRCLERHDRVIVRNLPGNHDEHSAAAVTWFLQAWYRNEPRVTVDLDAGLYWWHRFGLVLLGATHGHTVKIEAMPAIMAHRRAADWGATRFRYVHGFHLHHTAKFATENHGVVSEIHQAPIPQDAWHHGAGFLSGRSLQAITYHARFGETSRSRVAILDANNEGSVT